MRRVNEELFTTQLQFEERLKAREGELAELTAEVRLLRAEQGRLSEEVAVKEDKAEAESIVKETERLRDKNTHIESELKIACHKIEKMEILSEKAERMQAKKEVEIFKEIEDRLRAVSCFAMSTCQASPLVNWWNTNAIRHRFRHRKSRR